MTGTSLLQKGMASSGSKSPVIDAGTVGSTFRDSALILRQYNSKVDGLDGLSSIDQRRGHEALTVAHRLHVTVNINSYITVALSFDGSS